MNFRTFPAWRRTSGFSLLEVLIAVVVLSVGLLALAALQGSLVRGGSAAKAQTQAMALAQQTLEQMRGFKTSSGNTDSYAAIVAATDTVAIGANSYTRTVAVDRYKFLSNTGSSGGTFQSVSNDTTSVPIGTNEFKKITVTVSWTNESGQTTTVQQDDVISVAAPADSLSALASPIASHQGPKVYIDPSKFAAGVIPIALGNNQSAAASDPQPESFSTGHISTRFSVQSYSTADTSNGFDLLQKQFDFSLTSCTCNMSSASTSANPAYGPTYWNGTKFIAPSTVVNKPTGSDPVSNGNPNNSSQDPVLCNACCRDHHDVAVSTSYPVQFDPFRPSGEYSGNDHKHYDTDNKNVLGTTAVSTASGTEYYETCRFVRVDGVNYVATDAREENHLLVAPVSPITISLVSASCDPTGDSISGTSKCTDHSLDSTTSKTTYPNFVQDYMGSFYTAWQTADAAGNYPLQSGTVTAGVGDQLVDSSGNPTTLATKYQALVNPVTQTSLTMSKGDVQYLEGRGIYVDYIGTETKNALACIGSSDIDCAAYTSLKQLQILPFVAVNLTNLDSWGPTAAGGSISVTNASIPSGGTYDPFVIGYTFDRGTVTAAKDGTATGLAQVRPGNAGLIDSLTVSPSYPFEAFNCINTTTSASQAPCSSDPPATGYAYDTSTSNGPRYQSDTQPYTVNTSAAATNLTFNAAWTDNSASKNSNFNSSSIALTVTTPTLSPSTLDNCTLPKSGKQPYTCYSTSTDTTIVLQFAGYNSAVSCKPSKTVTCPTPAAVNDYKICSITGLPATVTATIGSAINSGCFTAGDPTGCTAGEYTPVTLTLNTSSSTVTAILASLTSLNANFYLNSQTCP
jgi:type IV pilus modification protein PilV